MSNKQWQALADLAPGGTAALAFLGMVGLLGTSWLTLGLSAILAGAVYLGVRWLVPAPPPEKRQQEIPTITARDHLGDLRQQGSSVASDRLRSKIGHLCQQADRLLTYFQAHPEVGTEGEFAVGQHLGLAVVGTRRYLEGTRDALAATRQSEQNLSELLDSILERFARLQKALGEEADESVAGQLKSLTKTLDELDSVYIDLRGKSQ